MQHRGTTNLDDDHKEAGPPLADRLLRNRRGILLAAGLTLAAVVVLLASLNA